MHDISYAVLEKRVESKNVGGRRKAEIKWLGVSEKRLNGEKKRVERFHHDDACDMCLFPGTDLLPLVDQLSYATACTIAAARIEVEPKAGGACRRDLSFCFLCMGSWGYSGLCVSGYCS